MHVWKILWVTLLMTLEEELLAQLDVAVPASDTKARNLAVVACFYCFGDAAWPTLDETGQQFDIGPRERAPNYCSNVPPVYHPASRAL